MLRGPLSTFFCFIFASVIFPSSCLAVEHNVTQHGVVGDGKALNTVAIQAIIDDCTAKGGGVLHFPAGDYVTGTIYLKDNIRLDLATGARILGSTHMADYPLMVCDYPSRVDAYNARALIWGEGLTNVAITGKGTIDGQGAAFKGKLASDEDIAKVKQRFEDKGRYVPKQSYLNRPFVIRLISCSKVLIKDITLRNSPMWMQHYQNCDELTIRGITVFNHCCRNNDMIDIDGCRNVVIADCVGDASDDGVTLKATGNASSENVKVTNCIVSSHCNAFKVGTESAGVFKNITIQDCEVKLSKVTNVILGKREGLAGIALEIVDGGALENVNVSNVTIEKTHAPIFMRLGNRARPAKPVDPKPPVGTFSNITFNNIVATKAGKIGCSIVGIPGHCIKNVTLSNICIEFDGGGVSQRAVNAVPEREDGYPECTMFRTLPSYGFFCRHVDGLKIDNVELKTKQPEKRPAWVFDDVLNVRMYK